MKIYLKNIEAIHNYIFIVIFTLAVFCNVIVNYQLQFFFIATAFITYYSKHIIYLINNSFSSIDLYFLFFVVYFLSGFIYFNSPSMIQKTKYFFTSDLRNVFFNLLNQQNLMRLNISYLIALTPLMLLINRTNDLKRFKKITLFRKPEDLKGFFSFCGFVNFFLILIFLYKGGQIIYQLDGTYALFQSEIDVRGLIGWFAVLISGLTSISFLNHDFKKKKLYSILIILAAFLFYKLHFRMFTMVILFALLMNFEMRGFKFKLKYIIFGILIFTYIAFDAIRRFETFNTADKVAVYFTVLGEFFLSQFYYVSWLTNPFNYKLDIIQYFDFITQLLPSSFRPESGLIGFIKHNQQFGFRTYPGGISILAQSNVYLGKFYPLIFVGLSIMLMYFRSFIIERRFTIILPAIPIVLMVIPRNEFWVARSGLINIGFMLFLYIIYKLYNDFKKKMPLNENSD